MGITVRELVTKLSVDGDKATEKLARFGLAVNGAKAALGLLTGAFDIAKQVAFGFVNDQTKVASAIADTAKAMGVEATELQRLIFIAERTGVPMTNLTKAAQNLARNLRDAASGGGAAFNLAMKEVGLTTKALLGLTLEEKFAKIGEALRTLPAGHMRVAAAQKLLGEEAGPKFVTLLELSAAEMKNLGDEAVRLGFILSDKALDDAGAFQDAVTDLNAVITGLKRSIGVELAPALTKLINQFKEWLVANRKIIKQKLQKFLDGVAVAVQHVMDNFDAWMQTIDELLGLLARTAEFIGDLVKMLGGIENALKLAAAAWATYRIAQALAFGPVGVVITGLLALAAAFIKIETGADRASRAQRRFGQATGAEKSLSGLQKKRLTGLTSAALQSGKFSPALVNLLAGVGGKDLLDIQREAKRGVVGGGGGGVGGGAFGVSGIGQGIAVDAGGRAKELSGLIRLRKLEITKEIAARKASVEQKSAAKTESDADARRARRAAAEAAANKRLRKLSKKGKKEKDPALSDEELFKLIQKASETGQSLTGLIGTRKIEGGTPPVVAVKIIKTTITQNINAPVTITGVDGEDTDSLETRFVDRAREIWRAEVEEAIQEITPAMAR